MGPKPTPKFNNVSTADFVLVVEGTSIHIHRKYVCKTSKYFQTLLNKYRKNSIEITAYNYAAMHAYIKFLYDDTVSITEETIEPLLKLAVLESPTVSLQSHCHKYLEERGILDPDRWDQFSKEIRSQYFNTVEVTGENIKPLMKFYTQHRLEDTLRKNCRKFLLEQVGGENMHKYYKWANKYGFDDVGREYVTWAEQQSPSLNNCYKVFAIASQAGRQRILDQFFHFIAMYRTLGSGATQTIEWLQKVPLTLELCFDVFHLICDRSQFVKYLNIITTKILKGIDKLMDPQRVQPSIVVNYCQFIVETYSNWKYSTSDNQKEIQYFFVELKSKLRMFFSTRYHWPNGSVQTYNEMRDAANETIQHTFILDNVENYNVRIEPQISFLKRELFWNNIETQLERLTTIESFDKRCTFYRYINICFQIIDPLSNEFTIAWDYFNPVFIKWPLKYLFEFYLHTDSAVTKWFARKGLHAAILANVPINFEMNSEEFKMFNKLLKANRGEDWIILTDKLVSKVKITMENLEKCCNELCDIPIMKRQAEMFVILSLNTKNGFNNYLALKRMNLPMIDEWIATWIKAYFVIDLPTFVFKFQIARELGLEEKTRQVEDYLIAHCRPNNNNNNNKTNHEEFWRRWFHEIYHLSVKYNLIRLQSAIIDFFTDHFDSPCSGRCKVIIRPDDMSWFYQMAIDHNSQHLLELIKDKCVEANFAVQPEQWYAVVVDINRGDLRTMVEQQLLAPGGCHIIHPQAVRRIYHIAQQKGRFKKCSNLQKYLNERLKSFKSSTRGDTPSNNLKRIKTKK